MCAMLMWGVETWLGVVPRTNRSAEEESTLTLAPVRVVSIDSRAYVISLHISAQANQNAVSHRRQPGRLNVYYT